MKITKKFKVSIVMGSQSDYKTMKHAEKILKKIGIKFEKKLCLLIGLLKGCSIMQFQQKNKILE